MLSVKNGGAQVAHRRPWEVLKHPDQAAKQAPVHEKACGSTGSNGQWLLRADRIRLGLPSPKGRPLLSKCKDISMKKDRDWKHEYQLQKKRGDVKGFLERQKARRLYDKKGIDRSEKDIDHIKPIRSGGKTTKGNLRLRSRSENKKDNKG